MKVNKCRINGDSLEHLFSLGNLYVSNFLEKEEFSNGHLKEELSLSIGKTSGLVQLENSVDFDSMYKDYWYNSGTNKSMKDELKNISNCMLHRIDWSDGDKWLDIGCNDGTLLSFLPNNIVKIGIDPSNSAKCAIKYADKIIPTYFSYDALRGEGSFKFISAIAMFYDLDNPLEFLNEIYKCLDTNGLFVVQMSYLPLMIKQFAFDNICHEHLTYFSLEIMKNLFDMCGFKIMDCEINDVNGGSFRIYAQKKESCPSGFMTAPFRDVANFRIESILTHEKTLNLKDKKTYTEWFAKIQKLKQETCDLIKSLKEDGKTIWGYGASTKGNTLLQYYGLDNSMIDAIAERQSIKYGLKTIGTEIPIKSEHEMRKVCPDYLLIMPWHFIYEFKEREKNYLKKGAFITPCPKLEIIR